MSKATYHHGNLRQALVEAAQEVLIREGAAGFTLAHAAKATGVTPAAVYRHFKGRDDLLAEVARQGHERLALITRPSEDATNPSTALLAYGEAFALFARSFPGHFIAIYLADVDRDRTRTLASASAQSDAVLLRVSQRIKSCTTTKLAAEMIAAHVHALCRGMVQPGCEVDTKSLHTALTVYMNGLGLDHPKALPAER